MIIVIVKMFETITIVAPLRGPQAKLGWGGSLARSAIRA